VAKDRGRQAGIFVRGDMIGAERVPQTIMRVGDLSIGEKQTFLLHVFRWSALRVAPECAR